MKIVIRGTIVVAVFAIASFLGMCLSTSALNELYD